MRSVSVPAPDTVDVSEIWWDGGNRWSSLQSFLSTSSLGRIGKDRLIVVLHEGHRIK